jgi:hypothetical protein
MPVVDQKIYRDLKKFFAGFRPFGYHALCQNFMIMLKVNLTLS